MGEAREFVRAGRRYRLTGLDTRAGELEGAARSAAAVVEARLASARRALDQWRGPHAGRYAAAATGVLAALVGLEHALRARARGLRTFPTAPAASGHHLDAALGAARVDAVGATGTAAAVPLHLRRDVEASVGHRTVAAGLAAAVHLDGVVGIEEASVPLDPFTRQHYLDAGVPQDEVDRMRVLRTTVLHPAEVAGLVALAPVDDLVATVTERARALEAFTSAVAAAFEQADADVRAELLGHLAAPGGAEWADVTAAAFAATLAAPGHDASELAAVVDELGALTATRPELAAAVVAALGPDGVEEVHQQIEALAAAGSPGAVVDDVLAPWSAIVAAAVGSASMADADVQALLAGLSLSALVALVTTAPFPDRFVLPAVHALVDTPGLAGHDPLGQELYHGDLWLAGALGLAQAGPGLAGALAHDPELLAWLATTNFVDDGAAAGAVLSNCYYVQVLADLAADPTATASLDASAAALALVVPEHGFSDGATVALAQIATLHLDELVLVVDQVEPTGPGLAALSLDQLVAFYGELLDHDIAQQITAGALGLYTGVELALGAEAALAAGGGLVSLSLFNAHVDDVAKLDSLFAAAMAGDAGAAAHFWATVVESLLATGGRATLAGLGVTGVPGAVAGGLWALAMVLAVEQGRPRPDGARPEWSVRPEVVLKAAAAQALVDHPELLASLRPVLAPQAAALLASDGFLAAVQAGDPASTHQFLQLLQDQSVLDSVLIAATTAA